MTNLDTPAGADAPDLLPVLGRGRHRRPRSGGCFMEIASFLAGERWSDHPTCTHPLLATVARAVNDCTSDAARPQLAPLIPSVIGLTSDDPAVDVRLSLLCATSALPVASAERQEVMATAAVASVRVLAAMGLDEDGTERAALDAALAAVPHAAAVAAGLESSRPVPVRTFQRRLAPFVVSRAVEGIARACTDDVDGRLRSLLREAVAGVEAWTGTARPDEVDGERWGAAVRLTAAAR